MAHMYVRLIKRGAIELNDVPQQYLDEVKRLLVE